MDSLAVTPPDTMGAISSQHVVTVLNDVFQIQRRNGAVISSVPLDKFWASLKFGTLTDPRIVFDSVAGRWITAVSADPETQASALFVGVSKTVDPAGSWFLQRFELGPLTWADFPAIGFNKNWVVVTVNAYSLAATLGDRFIHSNLYVFNKAKLYAGTVAPPMFFTDVAFGMAPSVDYDNTDDNYYLLKVDSRSFNAQNLRVGSIRGPVGSESYLTSVGVIHTPMAWAYMGNDLGQAGSDLRIDGGDDRMQPCVVRKSSLWCAHTVFSTTLRHGLVQWLQIGIPAFDIRQFGRIEDLEIEYAYPSIAVNKNGDMLLGFSRFSSKQFASASYALRLAGDPVNTLRPETVFKLGEAPYEGLRWGDYSATVVDPVDDTGFWTIQEYAASPRTIGTTEFDRWGTWWAQIVSLPAATPPCAYTLSQISQAMPGAGGLANVSIATAAVCPWMAASNVSWISIIDGTPATSAGIVHYSVAVNDSIVSRRTGTVSIGGQTFTVTQEPSIVLPDLNISALTAPATAFLGGSISVSATVRNSGAAKAGAFRVAVYLSGTAAASAVPAGAAFCVYSDGLAVGASAACAANVIIPASLAAGTAYIAAVADDQNVVGESDESNNFRVADSGPITLGLNPSRPAVTATAVLNAASLINGPVAPGLVVILSGSNLGPATLTNGAPDATGRLATDVSDTQLLFDRVAAPLLSVRQDQVKAIVPYSIAGKTTTQLQVQSKGLLSDVVTLSVVDAAPALLTLSAGNTQASALNEDGSGNTPDNPAIAGSTVTLFAVGAGQTDPPGIDGEFANDLLPTPLLPVILQIGDRESASVVATAVPGQVAGFLQISAVVPDDTPPGDSVPVVLTVGAFSSQPEVTIAVKAADSSPAKQTRPTLGNRDAAGR